MALLITIPESGHKLILSSTGLLPRFYVTLVRYAVAVCCKRVKGKHIILGVLALARFFDSMPLPPSLSCFLFINQMAANLTGVKTQFK